MTLLRTLTTIFPKAIQVSDDTAVINQGADYWAIFQPAAFPVTRVDGLTVFVNWQILFDFYVRYKTRKESLPKFKAARSEIFNLFSPFCLNKVKNVDRTVLSANGALMQDIAGDNPNFIYQTFSVVVTQRVTFAF